MVASSLKPILPVLLVLLSGSACSRSLQAYLEAGNRFFAQGKYDDAILQYRKALQKEPASGEAHYRLGLAEIKRNRIVDAYQEFRQAADLMPGNDEAWVRLGELSVGLYNADPKHSKQFYDQASKAAEQLRRKNPDGFDANRMKGALAIIDRKPGEAVAYLRKAAKSKPGDRETTLGLAEALRLDNQAQAGIDLALGLIRTDPAFGRTYDFLFAQYQAANRFQDAEDILKLKAANNPKQEEFLVQLARYYAVTSKPAEMAATLKRILDQPTDFPDGRMRVGDFYNQLGKFDEAARLYQEGLGANPKDPGPYRKRLVRVLAAQRKFPEALQQVDAILKAAPDDGESRLARAEIWLDEAKPENLDPAIAELRAQIKLKPQEAALHYQLGLALARKGDRGSAPIEWMAAAKMNRNYLPPRFALASMELSQGKPQEALQTSEEILAVDPANANARFLNAVCLTRVGRFTEARSKLNRLISDAPQSLNARYQLGVLAISERKYKEAEDIFRELEKAAAGNPSVIAGLAEAYQGQKQSGKTMELLQDELKRFPNSQGLRGLLARFAAASGNPDLAIEQFQKILLADPKLVNVRIALGQAYEAKHDYAAAESVFAKASEIDAKSVMALVNLAQAFERAGKTNEAKAAYRKAMALKPDDPGILNNLAFMMLETGDSADEALQLAQHGLRFANDARLKTALSDTIGWAYLKKKMYDAALQTFQPLVKANPANATYHYHLGATLYEKGDKRQARVELESALAAKPAPGDEPKIRDLLARR